MYCSKCGKEIEERVKFCPYCGDVQIEEASGNKPKKNTAGTKITIGIIIAMVVIFFICLIGLFLIVGLVLTKPEETIENNTISMETSYDPFEEEFAVGDVVIMGTYEQDGNLGNGAEPIEWDVIAEENGRYLLVSHYVLDNKPYDNATADTTLGANEETNERFVTWEKSSIRQWLNNDFYNSAFTNQEKGYIVQVNNSTEDYLDYISYGPDTNTIGMAFSEGGMMQDVAVVNSDSDYGTGGSDTIDSVFLLSVEEVLQYYNPSISNVWNAYMAPKTFTSPTPYAVQNGVSYERYVEDMYIYGATGGKEGYAPYFESDYRPYIHEDHLNSEIKCDWMLRSPGTTGKRVATITSSACCFRTIAYKTNANGIRPAIWIEE